MKKMALSLLAVVLLFTLVCGTALAYNDLTIKAAKVYADPGLTDYLGTIPKYTSVKIKAYGVNVAQMRINGVDCFVKMSTLTCGDYDYAYIGTATLKAGSKIYRSPSLSSKSTTISGARYVLVYAVRNNMALIRQSVGGRFAFVPTSSLTNARSY